MKNEKSEIKSLFFIVLLAGLLFFPFVSQAAGLYKVWVDADPKNGKFDEGVDPEYTVCYDGLVPCGKEVYVGGAVGQDGKCTKEGAVVLSCAFCHFPIMLLGIVNFLILPPTGVVFIIAVLLLVAGGAMFVFSGGRPALAARGRTIMTATIVGLVIIYAAWLLVNTFLMYIGLSEFSIGLGIGPDKWAETIFKCPIRLPQ